MNSPDLRKAGNEQICIKFLIKDSLKEKFIVQGERMSNVGVCFKGTVGLGKASLSGHLANGI